MQNDQDTIAANAAQEFREPPEEQLARAGQRIANLKEIIDSVQSLARNFGEQLETKEARLYRYTQELMAHRSAIQQGREALRVFTGDPRGFVQYLIQRQACAVEAVEKLIAFINLTFLNPEALRARGWSVSGIEVADYVEVLRLTLQVLHSTLKDEPKVIPSLPLDRGLMPDWLTTMRESTAKQPGAEPEPQGPVWYCPTCKRHVAPEDVRPYYPDVPAYQNNDHYHYPERGGCGEKVGLVNKVAE